MDLVSKIAYINKHKTAQLEEVCKGIAAVIERESAPDTLQSDTCNEFINKVLYGLASYHGIRKIEGMSLFDI